MTTTAPWGSAQKGLAPLAGIFTAGKCHGESLQLGVGATNTFGWWERLCRDLNIPSTNRAIGGTLAAWHKNDVGDPGYTRCLQDLAPAAAGAANAEKPADGANGYFLMHPWATGKNVLGAIGFGFNDLAAGGTAMIDPWISAMRTMIGRYLAAYEVRASALTYTGAWATGTATDRNSGPSYAYTLTNGDSCTLALNAGYIVPQDDMSASVNGISSTGNAGFMDVYLDAALMGSVDLSKAAPIVGNDGARYCPFAYRMLIPKASTGTIKAQARGMPGGSYLAVNGVTFEAQRQGTVIVKNIARPYNNSPYWATSVAQRDVDIATANARLKALCDEFARPGRPNAVRYIDVDGTLNKQRAYFWTGDDLHWSDAGHQAVADLVLSDLRTWAAS